MEANYKCPTCGATKQIVDKHNRGYQFPEKVVCGWRGCPDWALRSD